MDQQSITRLLAHLPAGVVLHDGEGRVRSANDLACELLGCAAEQLVGAESTAAAWHFVHEDGTDMSALDYPVNRVLHDAARIRDVVVGVRAATVPDHVKWLLCNAYPECDHGGQIAQVVVCFTDCTALIRTQKALQKTEERLRLILRGSSDAPWDCDLLTGEAYYAERWFAMLGHRPDELTAGPGLCLQLMHPDDTARVKSTIREMLAGSTQEYSIEFRLRHRDGHYVPILSRGFVMRDETGRAVRVSGTNTDLSERLRNERRLYEAAYFDHLTGLPNRRFLNEELKRMMARSRRGGHVNALLCLDLDNFKLLNETCGHDIGDMLLRQAAVRLRGALREGDQLTRAGGDEFIIVLEDLGVAMRDAIAETEDVVDRLLAAFGRPYVVEGQAFDMTFSIGVTMAGAAETDSGLLLQQAELAMYKAKSDGRNIVRFFDPGMQAEVDKRTALERALRTGLQRRQFRLFCQPQFDGDGRLIGAETLVRWQRDQEHLLEPIDFIGMAESTGLIVPLGQYVLEESCRALARWSQDPKLAELKLSVNVSVHQMRQPGFAGSVSGALAATRARADRLWLELTESVFADDADDMILKMQSLRGQGLHFTLDDFGTGYSSLSYLRRFPLAGLKIDRSFVHDVHLNADAVPIVAAIIGLARTLKLEVVAEGVECEEQRSFLVDGGCSAMQGYLFGRPIPIEEFELVYGSAPACWS